ncbi:MAG TPA: WG repeat-containing protein, partial [Micromonosporaceae bacterium]|nr:WG repeat-containing protein [Micromonosporaceae bacterium]
TTSPDTARPDTQRPDTQRPDVERPDLGGRDGVRSETFHDLGDISPAQALLDLGARITERPDTGQRDSDGTTGHSSGDSTDAGDEAPGTDWFTPKPHAPSTPESSATPPAPAERAAVPERAAAPAAPAAKLPTSYTIDVVGGGTLSDLAEQDTALDDTVATTVEESTDDDTADATAEKARIDDPEADDDADHERGDSVATEAMPAQLTDDDASAAVDAVDEADESAESAVPTDPEQILARYEWTYDPETLHEVVDDEDRLQEIRDMLTAKVNDNTDNASRARLLSLRAVVSRILGDLHKALADAKLALAHAEATGELRRIAICQARLANVLQWRGEYAEADRLFAEANSSELPDRLRGTMHSHAGRSAYDQGRYMEACMHFERALDLGKEEDPQLLAATELALDAVLRRVVEGGWGPYPRTREEVLQIVKPPTAAMDEQTQLWGFTNADGETVVAARYADIQPFRDGVAWVRRPESETWELIDEAGEGLIEAAKGYLGVSSFAGGLAWVSRDGNGRWIAIDRNNNVTISTGFDDVRPFRRGIAAVRRNGHWGAVDGVGRVIVPFAYDMFATALSDGRYIDGFSDEGLAVVQVGGRKGVVDRSGRTLVDPTFVSLVIHPVAFLMTDDDGRWGALDRKGRILIDPTHPSRVSVTMEIDRLLADARPVL